MMVLMAIVVNGYGRDCGGEKGASDIGADEDGCVSDSANNCGGDCGVGCYSDRGSENSGNKRNAHEADVPGCGSRWHILATQL